MSSIRKDYDRNNILAHVSVDNEGNNKPLSYEQMWLAGTRTQVTKLSLGGAFGYAPDWQNWVAAQPHVTTNMIPFLIEYPLGFDALPETMRKTAIGTLKAMVETIPTKITGIKAGFTVEKLEKDFGNVGKVSAVSKVKLDESQPQFEYYERVGRSVYKFFEFWVRWFMRDPISNIPIINTIESLSLPDALVDNYSMTVLFVSPDETMRYCDQAVLIGNMFPHGNFTNDLERDIVQAGKDITLTVSFTGLQQVGAGPTALGQLLLNHINLIGADPMAKESFRSRIARGIMDDSEGLGFGQSVETIEPGNILRYPNINVGTRKRTVDASNSGYGEKFPVAGNNPEGLEYNDRTRASPLVGPTSGGSALRPSVPVGASAAVNFATSVGRQMSNLAQAVTSRQSDPYSAQRNGLGTGR